VNFYQTKISQLLFGIKVITVIRADDKIIDIGCVMSYI
jgi:hypothetical protein